MGQSSEQTREDVALIGRIATRDQHAVAELYDRHSALLYGLILRIVGAQREAEEVLQEVFLAVWMCADTYDQSLGSPTTWLVRIALKRALDRLHAGDRRAAMLSLRQLLEEQVLER